MRWTRRRFLGVSAGTLVAAACGGDDDGDGDGEAAQAWGDPDDVAEVLRYGDADQQFVELTRPPNAEGDVPVVVLVHGGFWSAAYDLTLMYPLVPSLIAEGWAVANIEYRGVGVPGGGWPGTFDDATAAVDALADASGADLDRVIAIGHSAGGHLATWLAGRHRVPAGAPGAGPAVIVGGVVAQAGVLDLVTAAEQGLGVGATQALLGGEPAEVPDRYAIGSPAALLPIGVPVELVHGTAPVSGMLDSHANGENERRLSGIDLLPSVSPALPCATTTPEGVIVVIVIAIDGPSFGSTTA